MKQLFFILFLAIGLSLTSIRVAAQGFSFNTTGATAHSSAMLDVTSTSKGVLVPRMTTAQRNAIATPATGLIIFQTDGTPGYYYYSGSAWTMVGNMPAGTAAGQMLYWNGSAWVGVAAGTSGQTLVLNGGTPIWTNIPLNLSVGMSYGGGIVAYILAPGDPGYDAHNQHGLIAAVNDQSTGIPWLNTIYTTVGGTSNAIGAGLSNTLAIIANQGTGSYAAALAKGYTGGGYTDWYLPSKDELNKLYLNRLAIGNFAIAGYWSSSEVDYWAAIYQYFGSSGQYGDYKVGTYYVRAVRSF